MTLIHLVCVCFKLRDTMIETENIETSRKVAYNIQLCPLSDRTRIQPIVQQGDSMSNQPMNKKISTSLSQINLIFGVLIGSCMRTPKNPIFLCQLRSMSNLRSLKKFALFPKYDVPRPLL